MVVNVDSEIFIGAVELIKGVTIAVTVLLLMLLFVLVIDEFLRIVVVFANPVVLDIPDGVVTGIEMIADVVRFSIRSDEFDALILRLGTETFGRLVVRFLAGAVVIDVRFDVTDALRPDAVMDVFTWITLLFVINVVLKSPVGTGVDIKATVELFRLPTESDEFDTVIFRLEDVVVEAFPVRFIDMVEVSDERFVDTVVLIGVTTVDDIVLLLLLDALFPWMTLTFATNVVFSKSGSVEAKAAVEFDMFGNDRVAVTVALIGITTVDDVVPLLLINVLLP